MVGGRSIFPAIPAQLYVGANTTKVIDVADEMRTIDRPDTPPGFSSCLVKRSILEGCSRNKIASYFTVIRQTTAKTDNIRRSNLTGSAPMLHLNPGMQRIRPCWSRVQFQV